MPMITVLDDSETAEVAETVEADAPTDDPTRYTALIDVCNTYTNKLLAILLTGLQNIFAGQYISFAGYIQWSR